MLVESEISRLFGLSLNPLMSKFCSQMKTDTVCVGTGVQTIDCPKIVRKFVRIKPSPCVAGYLGQVESNSRAEVSDEQTDPYNSISIQFNFIATNSH